MAPTTHSTFSASSSARLLACPGSFELGQQLDDGTRKSNIYSAEGTLAHAISEACIFTGKSPFDFLGQTRSADGFDFTIDDDFAEAALQYVDFVNGLRAMGYLVALETVVSPTAQFDGLPDLGIALFGTADCIAYHPVNKHLVIGDLKFGAGVAVEALDNPQLHYYAAGAMGADVLKAICAKHGATYRGVDKVNITIVQPRAFHRDGAIRTHQTTPQAIRHWARSTLYHGIRTAMNDKGQTLSAGKHCRFCPVLPHCKKPKELSLSVATQAFLGAPIENIPDTSDTASPLAQHPLELTDDALSDILDKIEIIGPWLNAIKQLAQDRITQGRAVTGWKLVPKRALRKFADDDLDYNRQAMELAGLDPDDFLALKLLTPAQIEKKVGKALYDAHVAPLVVKTSSGNTLAPEGDPRARIAARRSAAEAFGLKPKEGN